MNAPLRFLAISGSLRAASSNTALLRAAIALAPAGVKVELYENMGELPHFNPDLESELPPVVADLRKRVQAADGVVICTPEYVHGLPGSFKNLLDWLVSEGELWDKPVAVLRVAGRGEFAHASLLEILKTLMARVSEATIPLGTNNVSAAELAENSDVAGVLRASLAALARAVP